MPCRACVIGALEAEEGRWAMTVVGDFHAGPVRKRPAEGEAI